MTNDAMRGLIERAIPIIETERECLFEGHHVNGVVEIIDEADQVSVDAMAEMDAWLTDARSIISQPEQPAIGDEPVCWINEDLFSEMEKYDGPGVGKAGVLWNCETDRKCTKKRIPLYAAPPPVSHDAASLDATYDQGRRDMLNAILALNPDAARKLHALEYGDDTPFTNVAGQLPFDVVFWVTEVADQLGIQPKDEGATDAR